MSKYTVIFLLVVLFFGICFSVLTGIFRRRPTRGEALRAQCNAHLTRLLKACMFYAEQYDDFPDCWGRLIEAKILGTNDTRIFSCPAAGSRQATIVKTSEGYEVRDSTFTLVGRSEVRRDFRRPVVEGPLFDCNGVGRSIGYSDGKIVWESAISKDNR